MLDNSSSALIAILCEGKAILSPFLEKVIAGAFLSILLILILGSL